MARLSRLLIGLAGVVLAPTLALAASSSAFEYFHGGYGHYFVTAAPLEIAALDSGQFAGWARTGESFDVLALNEAASANVCRFWSGQTFAPKSSHFYTPFDWECAIVKGYPAWQFEGEVFAMMLADPFGACAGGTIPLYRLYNDGKGNAPNHRYTTSMAIRAEMLAQGWIAEGRGIGVIGCVPVHTPTTVAVTSPVPSPWVGETVLLTAVARDTSGGVIPGTSATWSISNPAVATISEIGALTALATGTVEVTATVNGVSGTTSLTLVPAPRISVAVGTTKEVVFDWTTDRCADLDLPDQPARFVRAEDGSLVLIDGDAPAVYLSRGADFNSLRHDCSQPALVSADRIEPWSYENQEWLWVVYREGSKWHALIHNEYHDPIASGCKPSDTSPGNPCWYNSITYAVSTNGGRSFSKPSPPAHVVAPAADIWVPPPPGSVPNGCCFPEGYRSPTNIVRMNDGYYYALFEAVWDKFNEKHGVCIMRTANLGDPSSWRTWDGAGYNLHMTSPYVTGHPAPLCTPLEMPNEVSHLVYSSYVGRYMVVRQWQTIVEGRQSCGFFFELSADLVHWGKPQQLVEAQHTWCNVPPQVPSPLGANLVGYPSLVDHADSTVNFERIGQTPYLYYTRFNDCCLDRDLVRVPLTFTRTD